MPNKFKRAFSLLLAAVIILTMPSCGIIIINKGAESISETGGASKISELTDGQSTTQSVTYEKITTGDAAAAAKSALDKITARDFGGISIFIASTAPEAFVPSSAGDDMPAARNTRKKLVEEKLNTQILTISGTSAQIFEDLRTAEKAGVYYADIIAVPLSELGKFIAEGLLLKLNSLPFLDLGAEWFDADGMTQAAADMNAAYTVIGAVNEEPGDLYSIFWNRDLTDSVNAGNLYKLANNGVWIWDYMLTCARALTKIDGPQETSSAAPYGICSSVSAEEFINTFFAASGEHFCKMGDDGILSAAFGGNRASAAAEKIKKIFAADAKPLGSLTDMRESSGISAFYNGNSAFILAPLAGADWFVNMKPNWGILPIPKYDEAQDKYYSPLSSGALSFSTPKSNPNIEAAGVFISAFSAATGDLISDAFYSHMIKHVIRDDRWLDMIDLIRGGAVIDFARIFGSGNKVIAAATYESLYNAVRGKATLGYYFKQHAKTLDAQIRKLS